jgi:putative transposase
LAKKKANIGFSLAEKRAMVEHDNPEISVKKQCEMLSIQRSGLYYEPRQESSLNLELMLLIDKEYLEHPFLGVPRMTEFLIRKGYHVNLKRIRRLYRLMGIQAIYPKPRTTIPGDGHKIYPYLLTGLNIRRPNQVWACDITYIPMKKGFMYLVAIIDIYSRYVVGWSVSNSLSVEFCVELLKDTIEIHGKPEIFNTDQGVQFTCKEFTSVLLENDIRISMDGKGRAIDNIFIERLWRSVKQESIYLHAPEDGLALYKQLTGYFYYYNNQRTHQGIEYALPSELFITAA